MVESVTSSAWPAKSIMLSASAPFSVNTDPVTDNVAVASSTEVSPWTSTVWSTIRLPAAFAEISTACPSMRPPLKDAFVTSSVHESAVVTEEERVLCGVERSAS